MVSDFEPGEKTWSDEIAWVEIFLAEPVVEPFEILIIEGLDAAGQAPAVPERLAALAPQVRVVFEATQRSSALKDAALAHCAGELIAVVEADSLPAPGWLGRLVERLDAEPSLDVVSGRTIYGEGGSFIRALNLLDRGFIEVPRKGEIIHAANNGAVYRRWVLEAYPYPDEPNPFVSGELRMNRMLADGVRFGLVPEALMQHAFGGLPFIWDVRRNKGLQAAKMLRGTQAPNSASKFRRAWAAVRRGMREDRATVEGVGATFLRWYDWPLMWLLFLLVRIPEFSGALAVDTPDAFAAGTDYR